MAGIYIHIPFCKQACSYCDFHYSTTLNRKTDMVNALVREIEIRKNYLNNEHVSTIYFGGGTPSLLNQFETDTIMEAINVHFEIKNDAEITMEVNPDDIKATKLKELKSSNINRLSIGVQSFHNEDLEFMNRAHNSEEAITSIKTAQDIGFNNITMDLIYGVQTLSDEAWQDNLETFLSLNLPHLSAYCLTVEPLTALSIAIQKGKCNPVSEEKGKVHFELLMNLMKEHGFIQYEISNFCKKDFESKHNSSYWNNEKYLGIGPSAHSYNKTSRQWNIANNIKYIIGIDNDDPDVKEETLSL
ncbi:MAG: radical SAM family heme chaperone HemW, partial [Bacteroidetes bacterium]|nr:radical SAM family heme chaperone HemW [Bacteroidota bacterium]